MPVRNEALLRRRKAESKGCWFLSCKNRDIEIHHIIHRGEGGGERYDVDENLADLCHFHHIQVVHKTNLYDSMLAAMAGFGQVKHTQTPINALRLHLNRTYKSKAYRLRELREKEGQA